MGKARCSDVPLGQILRALAIVHRWEPERLFVITTCYIDESGTHDESPHMILGGWVGRWGHWERFDPKWRNLLKKPEFGLEYFHAKEFKALNWPIAKKAKFMGEAAEIAKRHTLFGFTITMKKEQYFSVYRGEHTSQDMPFDSQYGVCFRALLSSVPLLAIDALPGRKNIDLHFVLEDGHANTDADPIFAAVKKRGPPEIARILRIVTRDDKKACPGLQAADANAYNAFQYEGTDTMPSYDLPETDVWKVASSRSRPPIFRYQVTEAHLLKLKGALLAKFGPRIACRKARAAG